MWIFSLFNKETFRRRFPCRTLWTVFWGSVVDRAQLLFKLHQFHGNNIVIYHLRDYTFFQNTWDFCPVGSQPFLDTTVHTDLLGIVTSTRSALELRLSDFLSLFHSVFPLDLWMTLRLEGTPRKRTVWQDMKTFPVHLRWLARTTKHALLNTCAHFCKIRSSSALFCDVNYRWAVELVI